MPKILNPNAGKGTVVLNDMYVFVDGVLPCSKEDAPKLARILVQYYGCELVYDHEEAVDESKPDSGETSLAATATKDGAKSVTKAAAK